MIPARKCCTHLALGGIWVKLCLAPIAERDLTQGDILVIGIDFTRIKMEDLLYDPGDFQLLQRREVLDYRMGRRGRPIDVFMGKYLRPRVVLNLADQGAHLLSLSAFAAGYVLRQGF